MIVKSDRRQDSLLSFSHNIFFPMKDKFHILSNNKFVVCKFFKFWTRLEMCCLVKEFDLLLFIICLQVFLQIPLMSWFTAFLILLFIEMWK